ncbi:MAG: Signal transduction histidine kinase [Nocardioides sp.]|nr:Signal transduction histidine kinase [Nocardioides sp.]
MSTTAPTPPTPPSRWLLTAYSLAQVLWLVPLVAIFVLIVVGGVLVVVWVGLVLLAAAIPALRWFADRQRSIASQVLGVQVPRPYRPIPPGGPLIRLRAIASDPMTWRDLIWLLWAITLGWVLSLVVLVLLLAVVTGFIWWYGVGPILWIRSVVDRALLSYGTTEALEHRVQVLTRTRADAVDHSAAELRRLERDLHDGTQARLVSLSMSLGIAETLFETDPEAAQRMVGEARSTTTAAIGELRSVVRGIHPPVLADRGLDGAVRALALDMAVPVEVSGAIPGRPPAPIESAVYFAIAECLANAAKHAEPRHVWIVLEHRDGRLRAVVGDDGRGGADPQQGTGMRGVMRRLAAFDGTMSVSSPAAGPTIVTLEVPCDLSSPKTMPFSEPG